MPRIDDMTDTARDARLERERLSRATIQRILTAVLADHWGAVWSIYEEVAGDDWLCAAVFAGLPNTIKDRIRSMEHERRGTHRG